MSWMLVGCTSFSGAETGGNAGSPQATGGQGGTAGASGSGGLGGLGGAGTAGVSGQGGEGGAGASGGAGFAGDAGMSGTSGQGGDAGTGNGGDAGTAGAAGTGASGTSGQGGDAGTGNGGAAGDAGAAGTGNGGGEPGGAAGTGSGGDAGAGGAAGNAGVGGSAGAGAGGAAGAGGGNVDPDLDCQDACDPGQYCNRLVGVCTSCADLTSVRFNPPQKLTGGLPAGSRFPRLFGENSLVFRANRAGGAAGLFLSTNFNSSPGTPITGDGTLLNVPEGGPSLGALDNENAPAPWNSGYNMTFDRGQPGSRTLHRGKANLQDGTM
jgi:hypothetical protein